MEAIPADAGVAAPATRNLSVIERSIAVFVRPTQAWGGLHERAQWWFPLILMAIVSAGTTALLYHRALVPMLTESWEQQVANGQMQAEQLDQIERFFNSPAGLGFSIGQQVVILPILIFVIALAVWFGVGFVLGTGLKYRLALEVACWSFLIRLPETILITVLAWFRGTMRGVHVGFGVLVPDAETPTRLNTVLGVLLDAVGPFSIWYVIVGIIGAAALSGAPRRSVAWTLGVLYLVIMGFVSALAALMTQSSG
jgi:hypothetical protein